MMLRLHSESVLVILVNTLFSRSFLCVAESYMCDDPFAPLWPRRQGLVLFSCHHITYLHALVVCLIACAFTP